MRRFIQRYFSAALLAPALAMLLGASVAWGQEVQVYQSWKMSTADGKLLFLNFDPDAALPVIVDNGGYFDGEDGDDGVRDYTDISYLSSGLDLVAIQGETELWLYFGGAYKEKPADPPDNRQAPQLLFQADGINLRNLVTVEGNPDSPATEAMFLVVGQRKGKPVFRATLCTYDISGSPATLVECNPLTDEFPRPVASSYVPEDATGVLAGGGWLLTGGTEVVFIEPDGTTTTVFKKQGVLNGGERITDVAHYGGNNLLLATDGRRVLQVNAVTGGGNSLIDELRAADGAGAPSCTADRDQLLTVDVTEDQGETLVLVGDFACSEATLYTSTSDTTLSLLSFGMPESGTVTEGQFLDLNACLRPEGCGFDNDNNARVTIQELQGNAAAIRYLAENMSDCRCEERDTGDLTICEDRGINADPGDPVDWIDFLPVETHNLVANPTWIPGYLEASPLRNCELKAYIVKTDANTFTGITEGAWDIGGIFGGLATQCQTGIQRSDDPNVDLIVGPGWDVVTYAPTTGSGACPDCAGGPVGDADVNGLESMLASPFCSSTGVRTRKKSIFGVGFTVVPTNDQCPGVGVTDQLIEDLGTVINTLALPLISNPNEAAALSSAYEQAADKWDFARQKLVSQPNAADTNLGALAAQLRNVQSKNAAATYDFNLDNIQGDVETRTDMLLFWVDERLRQLIPLDGYDVPSACAAQ